MANLDQSGVRHLITKIFNAIQDVKNNIPEPMVMVNVTYSELKALRDSNKLTPGCEYRIIDYVTTTMQENTISAGHQFDIIVTADSENTLNEIVRACYPLDYIYINSFYSGNCWYSKSSILTFSDFIEKDGKRYCLYSDSIGDVLFDFDDKSKVYYGGKNDIIFYPSYYRCVEYGYNDWTPYDGISTIAGDDELIVPIISMSAAALSNLDNGAEIAESIRKQYDINYFRYAGANLSAWKIWYSLDNDVNRFKWASPYLLSVGYHYDSSENLHELDTWIQAIAKVCDDSTDGAFYETLEGGLDETFSHFGYTNYNGITQLTLYGRTLEDELDYRHNYHYKGIITIDGVEYDSWAQLCYNDDGSTSYATNGSGNIYILTNRIVAESSGKGVIYRMIDEWGNDCPYDFKNIQFKRGLYAYDSVISKDGDEVFFTYCYTFSWEESRDVIVDASIYGNNGLTDENDDIVGVYENKIGVYNNSGLRHLNNIVLFSSYGYDVGYFRGYCSNIFGEHCCDNSFNDGFINNRFGNNCCYNKSYERLYNNTFGDNCCSNTFEGDYMCQSNNNIFGNYCSDNKFYGDFYNNTLGGSCSSNKFGNGCCRNIFGNDCEYNEFSWGCEYNIFGNNCTWNKFGDYCNTNIFGSGCRNNIFGNHCYTNIFGNDCYTNTFGNYCSYNTFGNNCKYNKFGSASATRSYYRNIIFDNGNSYIRLYCTATTSSSKYYQNVRIGLGVNNTTTYKDISDGNVNQSYETLYRPADSKTLNV